MIASNRKIIFDTYFLNKVNKRHWSIRLSGKNYYAISNIKNDLIKMHHYLFGKKDGLVVDHINGDGLDNRFCNIRFINNRQNAVNSRGKRSISFIRNKYRARIRYNYKDINLGYFDKIEDAVKARELAEFIFFGIINSNNNNQFKS